MALSVCQPLLLCRALGCWALGCLNNLVIIAFVAIVIALVFFFVFLFKLVRLGNIRSRGLVTGEWLAAGETDLMAPNICTSAVSLARCRNEGAGEGYVFGNALRDPASS